jgi:hypothetical protein
MKKLPSIQRNRMNKFELQPEQKKFQGKNRIGKHLKKKILKNISKQIFS